MMSIFGWISKSTDDDDERPEHPAKIRQGNDTCLQKIRKREN